MEQNNTLDVLLQVEAKATALVNDSQEEADRRVRSCEENCRISYEDRLKAEVKAQEASLKQNYENIKKEYKNELDNYRRNLSEINVNWERFSALINECLDKE